MPYIISPEDGASLFYVDYRPPQALIFRPDETSITKHRNATLLFLHGWPMSGRMYDHLMLPLSQTHGIRCIATDRRGFGKSEWAGLRAIEVSYETFARDTLAIIKSISDLGPFTFVAASMGAGESLLVYELMKAQGMEWLVQGFIWLGPSLPYPMQTPDNPQAPPQETWNMILDGFRQDRLAFVKASIGGVFGTQHGVEVSEPVLEFFVNLIQQADAVAIERCCQILSNYDFNEKLQAFSKTKSSAVKVMLLHGTKDQGAPIEAHSMRVKAYLPDADLKVYENAAHGLYVTAASKVVQDVLAHLA